MEVLYTYYLAIARWLIAAFCLALGFLWVKYFKSTKTAPKVIAELVTADRVSIPISSKENIIGRSKRADILIPLESVHKKHAVLYVKNNKWHLAPLDGKISINLQNLTRPAPLEYGDRITIAKQNLTFKRVNSPQKDVSKKGGVIWLMLTLTAVQLLVFCELVLKFTYTMPIIGVIAFALLLVLEWVYFAVGINIKNFTFLTEIPVLFMTTLGLAVLCSGSPENIFKQTVCYLVGVGGYIILTVFLRYPEFCQKLQRVVMVFTVILLYYTAFFGTITGGARNWLSIGNFSFQPSELCKPAFIFCGVSTLYNVVKNPKLQIEFLVYSILSIGALAIMYDFGAVAIFFVGMLTVLTLRLIKPIVIFIITGAAMFGTLTLVFVFPYIARRFGVWLHAWEYADGAGYQQTRTMIAAASGGLLGVGGGNGNLSKVSAADTDLVFGILSEEWGGIIAVLTALSVLAIGIYAIRVAKNSDTCFYTIGSLSVAVMLVFQSALNILGSLDILPLTGVTLIFVSRGGTSVISALLMMAFIKSGELHKRHISEWRYENEVD